MTDLRRFIERMPKAELHVHVEGTLEPELKFDLARRNAINLPHRSVEEMRAGYDFDDLPSFLKVYYEGMSVLVTEQDFYDLTTAYLTRAHSQNVLYAEIFFDPQAHTTRGIAYETVIRGIRRAQADAEDKLGIRSQLIMCFLRDMSADRRRRRWSSPCRTRSGSSAWVWTPTRRAIRRSSSRRCSPVRAPRATG